LAAVACLALVCLPAGCGGDSAPTAPSPATGACTPAPGAVCFGRNNYIEYVAGDLPVVLMVPHGGSIEPAGIPTRTGRTVTDVNTIEVGRAILSAFLAQDGRRPHIIICHLKRTKLDANREIGDAAQGNAEAAQAWVEYHDFTEAAARAVIQAWGRGLLIDLHGHDHPIPRLELGYLLSDGDLALTDAAIDAGGYAMQSSLRTLLPFSTAPFSEALRGATSLGGLLEPGFASIPSPTSTWPAGDPYYEGGYSTDRYAPTLAAIQIEAHFEGVRDSAASRARFAGALASALERFASAHLGLSF
jgi:N-formylglutamate amidohydrolase